MSVKDLANEIGKLDNKALESLAQKILDNGNGTFTGLYTAMRDLRDSTKNANAFTIYFDENENRWNNATPAQRKILAGE